MDFSSFRYTKEDISYDPQTDFYETRIVITMKETLWTKYFSNDNTHMMYESCDATFYDKTGGDPDVRKAFVTEICYRSSESAEIITLWTKDK